MRLADELRLPLAARGNALRGAFGMALAGQACAPECGGLLLCAQRESCVFARVFKPQWTVPGRQGGCPAPYIVRPPLEETISFPGSRSVAFGVRLLGHAIADLDAVRLALQAMVAIDGIPIENVAVTPLGRVNLGDYAAEGSTCTRAEVTYLTPTEMREQGRVAEIPSFPVLVKHIAGRLADLCRSCGDAPWGADLAAIHRLAETATITGWHGRKMRSFRKSAVTGELQPLGGFVGVVRYSGIAPELWPLLRAGEEIHVGRAAAWGNGWFEALPLGNGTP